MTGKLETYWKKVGGTKLSDDFKDLILKIFSYDGKKRPTVEEIRQHPWMQKPFSVKDNRKFLMEKLQEKRSSKTADSSSRDENHSRGD
jgi:serine/threonine protein kinase